jgi:hypothetical protein
MKMEITQQDLELLNYLKYNFDFEAYFSFIENNVRENDKFSFNINDESRKHLITLLAIYDSKYRVSTSNNKLYQQIYNLAVEL